MYDLTTYTTDTTPTLLPFESGCESIHFSEDAVLELHVFSDSNMQTLVTSYTNVAKSWNHGVLLPLQQMKDVGTYYCDLREKSPVSRSLLDEPLKWVVK